jgi:predicted DNA-binding transcriptional regulator AlpA
VSLGRILPTEAVCERLGIKRWALWRMCNDGQGPPRVPINGNSWGYPENLFEQWLADRVGKPRQVSNYKKKGRPPTP